MQTASDRPATSWLSHEFVRIAVVVWTVGLVLVYLLRYEGWSVPFQLAGSLSAVLPTLHMGPHFREFWTARAWDFLCVGAMVASALGLGAVLTDGLVQRRDLLAVLFALAAGFWLLAVLVLILGAVSVAIVRCAFLVILTWLLPAPRRLIREFFYSTEKTDGWARLMLVCMLLALVLNLPGAMAPPFEYDELEYHLGALADYQRVGRIVFLPHNFYSNLPQLTEMLYLLATTSASDIAAKLLHWLFGVLSALAVFSVGRRLWTKEIALTAGALFYCVPWVQDLSQTARIDLVTTFYATLAFGALLLWTETQAEKNWVWLSALATGAAVATKWPAIPVVFFPAAAFIVVIARSLRWATVFSLLVAVFVLPWLLKNWLLTSNPVFPLFANWFHDPRWTAQQAAVFASRHYPTFGRDTIQQLFAKCWGLSFAEPGAVPLLLMTMPLLLLARFVEPTAKRAASLCAGSYLGWFCFTFRPWRFLFPVFGVCALVGAYALARLGRDPLLRKALRSAVAIVLAFSLASIAVPNFVDQEKWKREQPQLSFMQYILGQFSREEFVARIGNGVLEPVIWMNEHLPANARVVYIGEARVYYAKQPVVWSTAFDQHPLTTLSRAASSGDDLLQRLREQGITHVYVNPSELARLQKGYGYMKEANWKLIADLLKNHAEIIHDFAGRVVYKLD